MHPEAEEAKKQGNDCVKGGKFIEAMIHYTKAIKLEPNNHLLYSNRSLAFLKVDQYYHARQDALQVIKMQPKWPKGYFRKGEVEFKAEHYEEALMSFQKGLIMDPEDKVLQESVKKARKAMLEVRKKEKRAPWFGVGGGLVFGVLIVLMDQTLTKSPILTHSILQALTIAAFMLLGYGGALIFRYMLRTQREGLLDPPIELFPDDSEPTETEQSSPQETQEAPPHRSRKGGTAAGRARHRKGKS